MFGFGGRLSSPLRRALSVDDGARCAAIHETGFAAPWSADDIERLIASDATIADGLSLGDALVGFVLSRKAADEAEILTIALDKPHRGKKLSPVLLGDHIARVAQAGAARLFLEVDETNAPACALYARFGFRHVGRRKNYYAAGARADALVLRADL